CRRSKSRRVGVSRAAFGFSAAVAAGPTSASPVRACCSGRSGTSLGSFAVSRSAAAGLGGGAGTVCSVPHSGHRAVRPTAAAGTRNVRPQRLHVKSSVEEDVSRGGGKSFIADVLELSERCFCHEFGGE